MQGQIQSDAAKTMIICIDSYIQNVPQGCFYHCEQDGESYEFRSLVQMLVGIERILDSANFPQAFNAVRTFSVMPEQELKSAEDRKNRQGDCATFLVKIQFRQHASWQGTITWIEKNQIQPFRSVLELILLMDSVLTAEND